MFVYQTRTVLKAAAFAALVLSAVIVPEGAQASVLRPARQPADFTFTFDNFELMNEQSAGKLDTRLRRHVRRYCSANAVDSVSIVAESACRRAVLKSARQALREHSSLARASVVRS